MFIVINFKLILSTWLEANIYDANSLVYWLIITAWYLSQPDLLTIVFFSKNIYELSTKPLVI